MNKTSVEGKARCSYCKATITAENEHLPRIDYRETEILNLRQENKYFENEIKILKRELHEKDSKL